MSNSAVWSSAISIVKRLVLAILSELGEIEVLLADVPSCKIKPTIQSVGRETDPDFLYPRRQENARHGSLHNDLLRLSVPYR